VEGNLTKMKLTKENMKDSDLGGIKTAIILAAGRGSRLEKLTDHIPKCLLVIAGRSILSRMMDELKTLGVEEVIIVVGYKKDMIIEEIGMDWRGMKVTFVENIAWESTNNIYSLYLVVPFIKSHFILLESDILLDVNGLRGMEMINTAAVDHCHEGMNGTTVLTSNSGIITSMEVGRIKRDTDKQPYKTVNIYSFGEFEFMSMVYPYLERRVNSGELQIFYEWSISDAIHNAGYTLRIVDFSDRKWAEIDNADDLYIAKVLFEEPKVIDI